MNRMAHPGPESRTKTKDASRDTADMAGGGKARAGAGLASGG